MQVLDARRVGIVSAEPCNDCLVFSVSSRQSHEGFAHAIIRLPDFLDPAANVDAFLICLDRFLVHTGVTIRVGQIECVSVVIGGVFEAFFQQANITRGFVVFGPAVAHVVDEEDVAVDRVADCAGWRIHIFVCDAPIREYAVVLNGAILDDTHILVIIRRRTLENMIEIFAQSLFEIVDRRRLC